MSGALAAVVVAYDSERHLPQTLASLREQLRDGDELVVVDNASPGDCAAVARAAVPSATVIERETNDGFAGGCHAGAAASRAPLLFFLNPDAKLAPGCLDALRAAAAERPDWGAWQALVLLEDGARINSAGGITHWSGLAWPRGTEQPAATAGAVPHEVSFASGAALVVRRDAWESSGGFDLRYFMYGEDVDLSLRLRLAGWGVGIVPAARVEHDYEFAKGGYKWFYLERNRWWTLIGAYPAPLLALLAPGLLGLELALLAVAAAGGWLPEKLRAQRAVIGSLGWAWRRRRAIQATARIDAGVFAGGLGATLDSPYLGGAARVKPLAALQAAYWALVRRALGA